MACALVRFLVAGLIVALFSSTTGKLGAASIRDALQPCRGSIRTQVMLVSVYGQPTDEYVYTTDGMVVIQPPLQTASGQQETNPFNLLVQSQPLASQPGEITIVSATKVEELLFPYWHYTRSGATVQGHLVANHTTEAITQNLLMIPSEIVPNFWMPIPFAMAGGTTIEGQVEAMRVTLRIAGNTVDLAHPFRIDIMASGNCLPPARENRDTVVDEAQGGGGSGSSSPTPGPPTAMPRRGLAAERLATQLFGHRQTI